MAGKRARSRSAASTQEKGKRAKLNKAPATEEAQLDPQTDTTAQPEVAFKAPSTKAVEEIAAPKSELVAAVKKLETIEEVIAPLDTTKTVDDNDLISWDDPSPTNQKGLNMAKNDYNESTAVFEDKIDIFVDEEDTVVGSNPDNEKVKEEQIAPNTKPIGEPAQKAEIISVSEKDEATTTGVAVKRAEKTQVIREESPYKDTAEDKEAGGEKANESQESHENVSAFGRNVIFQSIKYNLDHTENLAHWIGLGAAGATETRHINAGNINLEVSIKYNGPDKEDSVIENTEPVVEKQEAEQATDSQEVSQVVIKEESQDDTQEKVMPSIETRPELTIDTSEAPKKQLRDTVLTAPLPAIASPAGTSITTFPTSKQPLACRFGANCSRRDTCTFDHSEGARKKICTFINTTVGCKNDACPFSHDHLGVVCKSSPYRSNCPNSHKCAFKHQDDIVSNSVAHTKPKPTAASEDENRQLTAAEIAQKAAMARASREVSVTSAVSAPPPNAPTGPQRGVKRSRGNEDGDVGHNAQRPRNHFQMAPNQFRQQQWNEPRQQTFGQGFNSQQGYAPQQGYSNGNFAGHQQGRGRGRGRGRGAGRGNGRGGNGRGGNGGDQGFNIRGVAGGA